MEPINVKEFVEDKLKNTLKDFVPNKIISFIKEYDEAELDFEKIITACNNVEVYRMTQKEIDEQIEGYPDYYESLKEGDIVYSDGEVAWEIDAVQTWIWETQGNWKNGDYYSGSIRDYIKYLYAQELAEKLEQETKS